MLVRLYAPASAIRTAYKRGTLLAKTEKKDFRGWIRQEDPRYFAITRPQGLNEMLSLGKGLSSKNSVTLALYADHVLETVTDETRALSNSSTPNQSPTLRSTEQRSNIGDLICTNLPYDDKTDIDLYGQPHVLEAEIGSDRAKLQLRCDPEFKELQAVRIVMAELLAYEVSRTVRERGTAVVKFVTVGDVTNQSIVTEWIYERKLENQVVFSPKRKIDERDIYGFFGDGKSQQALIKLAFVDDAANIGHALESASAMPIVLLDKTQRRNRRLTQLDDGW